MSLWLACFASLCLKPSPWLIEKARRDLGWLHPICHKRSLAGFTLAELLICIAILGVIATFTIPKIMAGQQVVQNNVKAKEVAAMISGAFQQAKQAGVVNASFKASDLTPYLNYTAYNTSSPIDGSATGGLGSCSSPNYPCVKLHNGGLLLFENPCSLGGTTSQNFMQIWFDPDGQALGTAGVDGPSKSILFDLYYDGFLTTRDKLKSSSTCTGGTYGSASGYDPSWFSW